MMSESHRLAPVFENSSSSAQKQNEIAMNNHLLFLHRNMPSCSSSSNNSSSNGYEEPKSCDPNNSSIYQSSILAVVNSQLPSDFSNHKNINNNNNNNNNSKSSPNDSLNTNNTNDETMALIKKEEDSHLEYDLLTTSIANRLSTQSIKSKASIANYTSINELEKRASAIITHSSSQNTSSSLSQNNINKNDHRGSFKAKLNEIISTNEMQLSELQSNLKKLTRTIGANDSVGKDSCASYLLNNKITTNESSPKSNSSMISELSMPASNSSSSACSITAKPSLNLHETDSGRHSMSDSPTQVNSQKDTKMYLINKNMNKSAAGTFTSKVTSSGTAVTLSQTMQNLEKQQSINNQQQQQQQQMFSKKKIASRSRDNNLMTKSSSFCRVPVLPTTESASNLKTIRSHSSNSRTNGNNSCNSNSNGNNTNSNNNNKCSSLSVNRNCSEL